MGRFLVSTALVTCGLTAVSPTLSQSREVYLNNGADQAGQDWTASALIWAEDGDPQTPPNATLGEDTGDIGVLPDRNLTQGQGHLILRDRLILGGLRIAGNGYHLIAHEDGAVLQAHGSAQTGPVLRFTLENDSSLHLHDIHLAGAIMVEGRGILHYSSDSAAEMTGLTVGADSVFRSDGWTAGAIGNDGKISLHVHQGDVENRGRIEVVQAGRVTGHLDNAGVLHGDGTQATLQLGSLNNRADGQVLLHDGAGLSIDGAALNTGRVEIAEDARLTLSLGNDGEMTNHGVVTVAGRLEANQFHNLGGDLSLGGTILGQGVGQLFNGSAADGTDGRITLQGGHIDGVLQNTTASSQVTGTGSVAARLNNRGLVEVTGDGTAGHSLQVNRLINFDTGRVNIREGHDLVSQYEITNMGEIVVEGGLRLTDDAPLRNRQTLHIAQHGIVDADIDNESGEIASSGRIMGGLVNQQGAQARLAGQIGGAVDNAGQITLAGQLRVGQDFANRQGAVLDLADATDLLAVAAGQQVLNDGVVNLSGRIAGQISNQGQFHLHDGDILGAVDNSAADAVLRGTGRIAGTVSNAGQIEVAGGDHALNRQLRLDGALDNRATGQITVATGYQLALQQSGANTGRIWIDGQLQIAPGQELLNAGNGDQPGVIDLAATGLVQGVLVNHGVITAAGEIAGEVRNESGGAVSLGHLVTGHVSNAQGGQVEARGVITGRLSNLGQVGLTGDLSVGAITNSSTGRLELGRDYSLTLTDGVLRNEAGTTQHAQAGLGLQGHLAGDLDNSGRVELGSLDPAYPDHMAMITGNLHNTGDVIVQGDSHITGDVTNGGTVQAGRNGGLRLTVAGDFHNDQSGVIIGRQGAGNEIIIQTDGQILQYGRVEGNVRFLGEVVNGGTIIYSTDILLDNQLNNAEPGRVEVHADVDANGFDTVNRGLFTVVANGNFHNAAQFDNSGQVQINRGGQLQADLLVNDGAEGRIDNSGQILARIDNNAQVNSSGRIEGAVTNQSDGRAALSGTVTGPLDNHGQLDVLGDMQAGQLVNHSDARAQIHDGATLSLDQPLDNLGRLEVAGVLAADLGNQAGGQTVLTGGRIGGDVANQGRFGGDGQVLGRIDNAASGRIGLGGQDSLRVDGGIRNQGLVQVGQNGHLSSDLDNLATGHILLQGLGQIVGSIENQGQISGDGRIDGDLDNHAGGHLQLGGQVSGRLTQQAGGMFQTRADATLTVDDFTNLGQSEITADSVLHIRNGIDNQSRMGVTGLLQGDLANAADGRIAMTGGTVEGALDNLGEIAGQGLLAGEVTNRAGGLFAMTGEVRGRLANGGIVDLHSQGTLRVTQGLHNSGRADLRGHFQGSIQNSGTLVHSGQISGNVQNDVGGLMRAQGRITGQLSNRGTLDSSGDLHVARLLNLSEMAVGAGHGLSSDQAIDNRGGIALAGNLDADIDNQGRLDVTDTGRVDGVIRNLDGGLLLSSGRISGGLRNDAGGLGHLRGQVLGPIVNDGRIETSGDLLVGDLLNRNGGVVLVRQDETLSVAADRLLQNDAQIRLAGRFDGALANGAEGEIRLMGGILDGITESSGLITGSGTIGGHLRSDGRLQVGASDRLEVLGTLTSQGGLLDLAGQVQGDLLSTGGGRTQLRGGAVSGTLTNHASQATLNGGFLGALVNEGGAEVVLQGGAVLGDVINASNSTLSILEASIGGNVHNRDGSTLTTGTTRIAGNLRNDALVSMGNGTAADVLSVGGLSGQGHFLLDLDLIDMRTDRIRVDGGAATGQYHFDFNLHAQASLPGIGRPLTVLEVDRSHGAANNYDYSTQSLPAISERIVYSLQRDPDNDLVIYSQVNPAIGALLGNVALTHSMIGSVINRPTSPYVPGRAYDDPERNCGIGSWGRAVGGHAKATGATENGISRAVSSVTANYYGMQVGTDLACFNGAFDGWDMSFGSILGVSRGDTTQPNYGVDPDNATRLGGALASITRTDFDQIYGGIYLTATRDRWSMDIQYRLERSEFEIDNQPVAGQGLGLADTTLTSRGRTVSGAVSYAMPLAETGWTLVPTAGFAWTKLKIDDLRFDDGFRMTFGRPQSKVGFLGGTLTRSFIQSAGDSALNIFATATYYKDFAAKTRSLFSNDTSDGFMPQHLQSDHLGAYSELSIGTNYLKVLPRRAGRPKQFSAGARIDGRHGRKLDSVAVTGQLRYQF